MPALAMLRGLRQTIAPRKRSSCPKSMTWSIREHSPDIASWTRQDMQCISSQCIKARRAMHFKANGELSRVVSCQSQTSGRQSVPIARCFFRLDPESITTVARHGDGTSMELYVMFTNVAVPTSTMRPTTSDTTMLPLMRATSSLSSHL